MATSYGKNINMTVFGGSHDPEIGVRVTGLPRSFAPNQEELLAFMKRRAPGSSDLSTPRKETDQPIFLRGIDSEGRLNGEELEAVIRSNNQRPSDYDRKDSFIPRPSHADFAARMKYGPSVDLRGGGHFSGRLTAPLCIVGGICLQYLKTRGIHIGAHLYSIGQVKDTPFDPVKVDEGVFSLLASRFPMTVLDEQAGAQMRTLIEEVRAEGDSVGGVIECAAIGLPIGLGEHMFDGVENRLSSLAFAIPGVKGIEFGDGFGASMLRGSQNNDPFLTDGKKITASSNHAGGILGGMTSGMPLIFRIAMKPTPSIFLPQDSVDMVTMTPATLSIKGRHDPCIAVRAVPIAEAVCAIAIYDLLLDLETKN